MSEVSSVHYCDRCGTELKESVKGQIVVHCVDCLKELNRQFDHIKAHTKDYNDE